MAWLLVSTLVLFWLEARHGMTGTSMSTQAQAQYAEALERFAMSRYQQLLTDTGVPAASGLGNGDLSEENFQLYQQDHLSGTF